MVNKSKHAVSLLLEMARRFYDSRMERAQMRFAPTRCPDVLPSGQVWRNYPNGLKGPLLYSPIIFFSPRATTIH